jgi:Sulfotransferase domain
MPVTRQALAERLPGGAARALRQSHTRYRTSTAPLRVMPTYLIIGGQRCGTTSLYEYLCAHPAGCRARGHEVHYFTLNFTKGPAWYRGHFPTAVEFRRAARRAGVAITGEASPYYLFHPMVPERVRELLPDVRLLILLRDPVDRAYSHYQRELQVGVETLSFEDALEAEPARLEGEDDRLRLEVGYRSFAHRNFSYVARGLYADQLRRWLGVFPREQILVARSEDLSRTPESVLPGIYEFLGLPPHPVKPLPRFSSSGEYSPMREPTRRWLVELFREPNRELCELLGWESGWSV